jgi:hypothetical protein
MGAKIAAAAREPAGTFQVISTSGALLLASGSGVSAE